MRFNVNIILGLVASANVVAARPVGIYQRDPALNSPTAEAVYKTCTAIGAAGYFACRLLEAPNTGNAFVAGGLAGAFAEAAVRWARPEVVQSMKGMARGATDMAKGAAAKAKEVGATAVDWAKEQATKAAGSAKEAAAKAAKLVTGEPKGKQPDLEASISHDTRSLSPLIGFPP